MKTVVFVLQSGFAIGNWYWDNFIQNMLCDCEYAYLDNFNQSIYDADCVFVGVGHSLGFAKLISAKNINFDILVGIQAFVNFCGFDARLRTVRMNALDAMRNQYLARGTDVIYEFYDICGISDMKSMFHETAPLETLNDFDMLYRSYKIPVNTMTIILHSDQDDIVPKSVIQDNFAGISGVNIFHVEHDMHNLGYEKSDTIFSIIYEIVNEIL